MTEGAERYRRPGWVTRHVVNPAVARLTRAGVSVWGSRVLTVQGRATGRPRSVPVNVLTVDDARYLVSPRGVTEWVRNLRAAGTGELRVGGKVDRFRAQEVAGEDKPDVLRAYLRRWKMEVGVFFEGVDDRASDDRLLAIAKDHPVFRLELLQPREH